ncbi:hypothetical protein I552_4656 [Mycobacterium xenopi 3993]|nr:hypothetical protein I552_4656 [Mycobacterium xenopi 3993]
MLSVVAAQGRGVRPRRESPMVNTARNPHASMMHLLQRVL